MYNFTGLQSFHHSVKLVDNFKDGYPKLRNRVQHDLLLSWNLISGAMAYQTLLEWIS